jgi:hypothetical protein
MLNQIKIICNFTELTERRCDRVVHRSVRPVALAVSYAILLPGSQYDVSLKLSRVHPGELLFDGPATATSHEGRQNQST